MFDVFTVFCVGPPNFATQPFSCGYWLTPPACISSLAHRLGVGTFFHHSHRTNLPSRHDRLLLRVSSSLSFACTCDELEKPFALPCLRLQAFLFRSSHSLHPFTFLNPSPANSRCVLLHDPLQIPYILNYGCHVMLNENENSNIRIQSLLFARIAAQLLVP